MKCPASPALSARAPKSSPPPAAQEGILKHEEASLAIVLSAPIPPSHVDVKEYVTWVRANISHPQVEVKEIFNGGNCYIDASGPALTDPKCFVVADLKTGYLPVEAEMNWQLIIYAGILALKHPAYSKFSLVIYQDHKAKKWAISREKLLRLYNSADEHAKAILNGESTGNPGTHCSQCRGRAFCKSFKNTTLALVSHCSEEGSEIHLDQIASEYRLLTEAKFFVSARIKALEDTIMNTLGTGVAIPGIRVHYGKPSLVWSTDNLPKEFYQDPKPITPLQARKKGYKVEKYVKNQHKKPTIKLQEKISWPIH